MPVPQTVTRWLASQYPSLQLAEQWLEECHAFLQENFQLTAPALLKKIENQLLLSDLATSTEQHAGLFPPNDEQTDVFFRNAKGAGVLVQVLEIVEIGRPALDLLKLHRERVEDRKVFQEQGRAIIRAVNNVEPTQDGNNGEGPEGTAEAQNNKGFPRAMLRLRVSDGYTEYVAIETKRIPDLSMDDTPLGCKLMFKNVRCLRGVLALDEVCCKVKGGSIPDLENDRDALVEAWLSARIDGNGEAPPRHALRQQRTAVDLSNVGAPRAAGASASGSRAPAPPAAPPAQGKSITRQAISVPASSRQQSNGHSNMAQSVSSRPNDIISEEDEFDLDDVDFEEALAVLQEAEASSSGTRVSSAQAPSNSHSHGVARTHASVARPPPAGRIHAQSNARPAQSASTGPQQRGQTSLVIDIDDSDDDDEEVALMLISEGSQEGRTRKTELGSRGRRTNQPIEID